MSSRPYSLNDIEVPTTKIRRDQYKKILEIVRTNIEFPIIALGLIRDYVKNSSARDVVKAVNFDNNEKPTQIQVWTPDTQYHFRLTLPRKLETPTL
jgi:hypothetical protein